jgi:hypothetical protein
MGHWAGIATIFSDHSDEATFRPQNRAIEYVDGQPTGLAAPSGLISPQVFMMLKDINPKERRPPRDGEWVKIHWKQLVSLLSTVWDNFNRSGQQVGDAESEVGVEEWVTQFAHNQKHVMYAILVLDMHTMTTLPWEGAARRWH